MLHTLDILLRSIAFRFDTSSNGTFGRLFTDIIPIESFSHQRQLMVFRWSPRDCKSPQETRTRLSIMTNLNNIIIIIIILIMYLKMAFPWSDGKLSEAAGIVSYCWDTID